MDRFWSKTVAGPGGCILWIAALSDGYGKFYLNGKHKRAHRVAYEMIIGPIPDGLVIDHLCRVSRCVNPYHLEPVTNRINLLRGVGPSAKHAVKTHCPRFHPYEGDNVHVDAKGSRHCKTCSNEQRRERRRA